MPHNGRRVTAQRLHSGALVGPFGHSSPNDPAPFEKYAAAAQSLVRPALAARALNNGAPNIERADKLVQPIAGQKGLRHPVIDGIVALVDSRLDANRKKALDRCQARYRFGPYCSLSLRAVCQVRDLPVDWRSIPSPNGGRPVAILFWPNAAVECGRY